MSLGRSLGSQQGVELPDFPPVKMLKPKVLSEVLGQAISGGVRSSLYVLVHVHVMFMSRDFLLFPNLLHRQI